MASIKPAEVSAILRQELSGYKNETELQEVGTVLQVGAHLRTEQRWLRRIDRI
jgi:F0F1-type ATP synthase alpha subunit